MTAPTRQPSALARAWERLWAPEWAGGWAAMRVTFALAALAAHGPRVRFIEDAYASFDMVFDRPPFHLARHVVLSPEAGYAVWGLGVLGILGLLLGGRLAKPSLLLWLLASWVLLASEGWNIKAYDRLVTWEAFALLLAPIGERGLARRWRSPLPRWVLLVVFIAIYGSTGWLKATVATGHWLDGSALRSHLVDLNFAHKPLGAWLSGFDLPVRLMAWTAVLFECSFPLLVLVRRTNPWALAVGASFHLGVLALMNVGPFSYVALAAYPVLLHPEVARRLWERAQARLQARRTAGSGGAPA